MHAADIMTHKLITVAPQTSIKEAVTLLLQYAISALPVLSSGGELVGIISEGDLLRRTELGTERHLSRWRELLGHQQQQAGDYARAHTQHVAEAMTLGVICITPEVSLSEIVALMEAHHVKRLPVIDNGKLVGIVSRADLLRALICELPPTLREKVDDDDIRRSVHAHIDQQPWTPRACIRIHVYDGIVTLSGTIRHQAERAALRVLVENVAGVKGVIDQLVWVDPIFGSIVEPPVMFSETPGPIGALDKGPET